MGMFGRARQLVESRSTEPLPNVKTGDGFSITPGRVATTPARRGAFGRGWLTPERLQVIGATLQQLDGGSELTDYLATQRDNARQDQTDAQNAELMQLRMQRAKRETIQQQELDQLISTLPQEAQVWARLNPEAFVTAMIRRQSDGEWQGGRGYTNLWRATPEGRVELGDRLPLRPYSSRGSANASPELPSGFQWED